MFDNRLGIESVVWLPWWLSGKESTCQCRRHGFDPWSGKIPYAAEQQSPCTVTVKPVPMSPGTTTREATTMRSLGTAIRE